MLANALGKHEASRRWTWHSPNGGYHNQIDYIMVRRRFLTSVNTAKTRRFLGADIGSDHDLVMMSFRLRLKKIKMQGPTRINWHIERRALKEGKTRDSRRAEKYRAVNQEIKKGIKNQEYRIDAQCQDIEDNIRKNNNKKANQLVKTLTRIKRGQTNTIQDKAGNLPYRNQRHSKKADRVLRRTVQPHRRRWPWKADCPTGNQHW